LAGVRARRASKQIGTPVFIFAVIEASKFKIALLFAIVEASNFKIAT